jgi:TRAP-type C4-dicarboxylate transport system substrate-binding protein
VSGERPIEGCSPKGRRRVVLAAGMAAAMASIGGTPALRAQPVVRLDLSTVLPDGNFHTTNCRTFADEVGKATGGAVRITVHAGGALGYTAPEHLTAVRDGLVQMADLLDTQQAGDAPLFGIEAVPFLVADMTELALLHRRLRPAFDTVAARFNQTILYVVPSPAQCLLARTRIDGPSSLRGVRVRVADRSAADMAAALGMVASQLPWIDTRPALASGAVAAVTTTSTSAVNGQLWQFLRYFHRTNHAWGSQVVTINNGAWKRISPAHRAVILNLAARLQPRFWQSAIDADAFAARRLVESGMEVVDLSPATMKEMRGRTSRLEKAFVERAGMEAGEIIAAYRKELGRA